jgi:type I restriction enzyme S subunit
MWLGEVPEHWGIAPLKAVTSHNDEVLAEDTPPDYEIAYVDISGVETNAGITTKETMPFAAAPSRARRRVRHGDVIVSTVRTYLRAIARIVHPEDNLIASTGFAVIRPRSTLSAEFVGYMLSANYFIEQVIARSTGVSYPAINASELVAIPALLPPLPEQSAIAAFLDRETAKIDALIAEQQRLIELLQEKRQTVISHAVTKGLNPDAPMKDSGIEWLGEVPEHWRVMRLAHCGRLQNGLSIGGEAFGTGDPFVSYGDVYNNANVPEVPSGLVQSTVADQEKCGIEFGDVLFTRTSEAVDDIGIASTCLRTIPHATFAGFLIRFRPHEGTLDPSYSTYLFRNQGVKEHFAGTMNIVTRASLSQGELKSLPICLPPLAEQRDIAEEIDTKTEQVRCLIDRTARAITLLQERRSALISAAVTGQIDVRGLTGSEAA